MEAVKEYLALCTSADAFHETASTSPQHKAIESLQKQLATHRDNFLTDVAALEVVFR